MNEIHILTDQYIRYKRTVYIEEERELDGWIVEEERTGCIVKSVEEERTGCIVSQ